LRFPNDKKFHQITPSKVRQNALESLLFTGKMPSGKKFDKMASLGRRVTLLQGYLDYGICEGREADEGTTSRRQPTERTDPHHRWLEILLLQPPPPPPPAAAAAAAPCCSCGGVVD
jgi:hypothetical protein